MDQSLIFSEVPGLRHATLFKKRVWDRCNSCLKKNTFFIEHLRKTASKGEFFSLFCSLSFSSFGNYQLNWKCDLSSNINEVIKTILDFFIQKFYRHRSTGRLQANKNKICAYKYMRRKKSLICLFAFLFFCLVTSLCYCTFCCVWNLYEKKMFKTALITSFILLLNLSYYKHEFF